MAKLPKEKNDIILDFINQNPACSSKTIHDELSKEYSYATVKRILHQLITENLIVQIGKGRGTKYEISQTYNLFRAINVDEYFEKEIDEREIRTGFNYLLITEILDKVSPFTNKEVIFLSNLQKQYIENSSKLSKAEYNKEMERLAIDLSWKSSQIEGNTYSLLETELLLKEKETALGKTKDEATMLLNHKAALDFLIANPTFVKPLTISSIEDIHSILIQDLGIDRNIRNKRVGISGTNYKPIDNEFQIKEAFVNMCKLVNNKKNVFDKALLVLVLISYIQGFADGNKRTARIISNAILMNNNYCPISYRTVNSIDYKKAMLIFYEQNNINLFKEIFIKQFEFAVNTYF